MDLDFETKFWLNIFWDHIVIIKKHLGSNETVNLTAAHELKEAIEEIVNAVKGGETIDKSELVNLTEAIRRFKLDILSQQIKGVVNLNLSVAAINDMVNELDEYRSILTGAKNELNPVPINNSIHHHKLWTADAVGHCAVIMAELDPYEKDLKKSTKQIQKQYRDLHDKAAEFAGLLRTGVTDFPALKELDKIAMSETTIFNNWLSQLLELRLTATALGNLMPFVVDHFYREECYYMFKVTGNQEFKIASITRDERSLPK